MAIATAESMYHRVLRVAAVVTALALLFESGLVHQSTAYLALNTHYYLAQAVGMSVGVEPNELNSLTAELTKQQRDLAAREAAISEREIEIGLAAGQNPNETSTYVLASVLFILLVLIVLNYTLDYVRAKQLRELNPKTV